MAWGSNRQFQCNVPAPNADFVAVAAGNWHSLGLKADGSIVAWGYNRQFQTNVPAPNADFVAVAAGGFDCLGIRLRPGDRDGNGRTDLSDYSAFSLHLAGPARQPEADDWRWFDYNGDGRVDLADFTLMQAAFSGD